MTWQRVALAAEQEDMGRRAYFPHIAISLALRELDIYGKSACEWALVPL
jgi:hypothetical protein